MRFVGIDVGAEKHVAAVLGPNRELVVRGLSFEESVEGYEKLFAKLGDSKDTLVGLEATGHYWKNLYAALVARGFAVVLINPLQTHLHAKSELKRAKTDKVDAQGIARFLAEKQPAPTSLPDEAELELKELVRMRDRMVQDLGDRVRQLHRLVDLGFPEFTRYVRTLDSFLATAILAEYPTARAFWGLRQRALAHMKYDGRHRVGLELAGQLIDAAQKSVGQHHGPAYAVQVKYLCEDIQTLKQRIKGLDRDIDRTLDDSEVGSLLLTIGGLGPNSVARILAAVGDPARFHSASALAAYVGAVPGVRQSGKKQPERAGLTGIGNRKLRRLLYMPTLAAVRHNPWLKAHYERMLKRGKLKKVALLACMRKLLTAVYSVAKNRRPFVPILRSNP